MSLDGFVTGPNPGVGNPLGDDRGRLHEWMTDADSDADAQVLDEVYSTTGAIVIGKRMFDVGEEPWGDPPPFHMPVFIVTHEAREPIPKQGGTTYTFVTGGIEEAIEKGKAAAGVEDVGIWGGANVVQQCLGAGLLDEIQIHLVPVLLGEGVRLFDCLDKKRFELQRAGAIETSNATHLRFTVAR